MKYSVLLASAVVALGLSACNKPAASAETGYPAPQGDMGGHGSSGNMTMPDDGNTRNGTGTQSAPGGTVPQTDDSMHGGMDNQSNPGSSGSQDDDSIRSETPNRTNPGTPAGPGSGTTVPPSPIE
ncbi:hypothetical protein CAP31_06075 [Sulfuriferula sp. AH1]|uniref:hypothetical protein n=1 Tax=Sulfuriferula sp. AH1 TaxID=1985873 RepID=UPI000B3B8BB7|nr:hypothetical protein [Sulfuriferula sp. AH1]ARU31289.1 hypothetical protein CAP31_06075 [Sulfuriferula sp. AH1]